MMRSWIADPANLCSAEFIVTHAARSLCSSSRWIRRSRFVSSRALIVTPKRWNGVVESSGGSWNRAQLIAARSTPCARLTVASLRPSRYTALKRLMSAGFSSAVTGVS
jgi:hypothetical protein